MPRPDESDSQPSQTPTSTDVAAYFNGEATPEQMRLVRAALDDPKSPVHQWISGVEEWAHKAFPPEYDFETGTLERHSAAMEKLNSVLEFIRTQEAAGVITEEEASQLLSVGHLDDFAQFPKTPSQAITSATAIVRTITELHPELSAEMAKWRIGLSR
jgi:hypothetical protein